MTIILGSTIVAAWAAVMLWSVWRIARAVAQRQSWRPATYIAGMTGAALLVAGLLLVFRQLLPDDVFGAGFLLAALGTLALWSVGLATKPDPAPVFFDDPIFTEEGDVRPLPNGPGQGDGAPQ